MYNYWPNHPCLYPLSQVFVSPTLWSSLNWNWPYWSYAGWAWLCHFIGPLSMETGYVLVITGHINLWYFWVLLVFGDIIFLNIFVPDIILKQVWLYMQTCWRSSFKKRVDSLHCCLPCCMMIILPLQLRICSVEALYCMFTCFEKKLFVVLCWCWF